MNRVLLPAFKITGGVTIDIDPSDLPELQADLGKMVTWLKDAWWLSPNQKLDMMGEEQRIEPEFNEVWVPTGITPMSQMNDGGDQILSELQKRGLNDTGGNSTES
jgi:hypothetical protein